MKAPRPSVFTCLGLVLFAAAAPGVGAQTRSLVDATFNNVTTARTAAYPPSAGTRFREVDSGFSGWAGGGQLQLSLAPGYGTNGTGGVHLEILKEGKFYQATFQKLSFPMLRPGRVIREPLQSLRFSVDAKIPTGKEVIVYLSVDVPKDIMAEAPWSKRLVLGTLRGTDAYQTYAFSGAEIPEDTLNIFINFIRDLQLNGMQETVCSLIFHMNPDGWTAGDGLLFDNVKLSVSDS
jgi:hypothetical protein